VDVAKRKKIDKKRFTWKETRERGVINIKSQCEQENLEYGYRTRADTE
jgi:hypothetical protein